MHKRGKSRWAVAGLAVDRAGRPSALLAVAVGLGSTGRIDRSKKGNTGFLGGRPGGRPRKPENKPANSRSTWAVGRQTCTSLHVLCRYRLTGLVGRSCLKQKNSSKTELEMFCCKNIFEVKITKYHDRKSIHDLNVIFVFVKLGVMYNLSSHEKLRNKNFNYENLYT